MIEISPRLLNTEEEEEEELSSVNSFAILVNGPVAIIETSPFL
jgi:hypothetical protein